MIHSPTHLIGVAAYAALSLAALIGAWVRVRRPARPELRKVVPGILSSMGIGLGLYALDEWLLATEWPSITATHHFIWHDIGAVFVLGAIVVWVVVIFRFTGGEQRSQIP